MAITGRGRQDPPPNEEYFGGGGGEIREYETPPYTYFWPSSQIKTDFSLFFAIFKVVVTMDDYFSFFCPPTFVYSLLRRVRYVLVVYVLQVYRKKIPSSFSSFLCRSILIYKTVLGRNLLFIVFTQIYGISYYILLIFVCFYKY